MTAWIYRFGEGFSTGTMLFSMLWMYTRYPLLREALWLDGLLLVVYAIHWFHSFCYHLRQTDEDLYLDKLWIGRLIHVRIVRLFVFIDSTVMRVLYAASVLLSLLRGVSLDIQNYLNYTLALFLTAFFAETRDVAYSMAYLLAATSFALGYWFWSSFGVQSPALVVLFHLALGFKTYREEVLLQKLNRAHNTTTGIKES
ncbi:hypothetical protein EBZ80_05395 [bacterium]|nr:hypothetical protein [bacterium]